METGPVFVLRRFKAHAVSSAQILTNTDLGVTNVSTAVLSQHKSMGYFFWTLVTEESLQRRSRVSLGYF